jgi:hypothetical protein
MAKHISNSDIKKIPVVPYPKIRGQLKSGDLLFASGDYLVSKAIQSVTDSPWSHVGIVLKIDAIDRMLLLESVEDMGVRIAPLSKYTEDYEAGKPYKGRIVFARCKDMTDRIVSQITEFGIDELTQPYDKHEIANILARITLGLGRRKNSLGREYICSELVFECFKRGGKEFKFNPKGFISPEDIWIDEKLDLMERVR